MAPLSVTLPHKVSLLMRIKHVDYKRRFRNLVERFHGTSCDEGCNFMVDPQVNSGHSIDVASYIVGMDWPINSSPIGSETRSGAQVSCIPPSF